MCVGGECEGDRVLACVCVIEERGREVVSMCIHPSNVPL